MPFASSIATPRHELGLPGNLPLADDTAFPCLPHVLDAMLTDVGAEGDAELAQRAASGTPALTAQREGLANEMREAREVAWAVAAASRFTPWSSTCLVQVLAAQRLLQQRSIPGAFYIGAAAGEEGATLAGLEAHAWLRCGEHFITGRSGHERFTVVTAFSWG